ncbi:MAG: YhjD/YihY/BrkB family envelope integrity protein [Propionibacteriaceae bacterium]|nr:YhjD/YihY/BrkB family envelope integrity protein [Propionibacteriaceae bacterium]
MNRIKQLLKQVRERPVILRLTGSLRRFYRRHGLQRAAAISYFSVLTLIPVLMLIGAAAGFTLTVVRPDWLELLRAGLSASLGESELGRWVDSAIEQAAFNWRELVGIAVLTAAYSGINWVGNLRIAFNVMLHDDETAAPLSKGIVKELASNLGIFVGLLVFLLGCIAVVAGGIAWLGSSGILVWLGRIVLTFLATWLLFAYLYLTLAQERLKVRHWLFNSLGAAVLTAFLQQFAGYLIAAFSQNPTALIFGPVIVIMVMFNLMALIVLVCFAWTGERVAEHTDEQK